VRHVLKIGVVGDVIPADSPLMSGQGTYSASKGDFDSLFSAVRSEFSKYDFLIGNFEAVLVEKIDKVSPGTSAMKAPVSVLPVLKRCGFKYMSVANNHTMEYGPEPFKWMCKKLNGAGLLTFGHKDNPCLIVNDGRTQLKLGLLGFSTVPALYGFDPEYYFVDTNSPAETDLLLQRLREAKAECDQLLVFPHWGNEFMTRPAPAQINLARDMVASGADAIFGAHPHVIQSTSMMDSVPVYFSLGNLLSDYVQKRFKRNAVVSLEIGHESLESAASIFSCDNKFRIYNTEETLDLEVGNEQSESDEDYADEANRLRKKVRNELIVHLLKYPWRWMFNRGLWGWLVARFVFLVRNHRKIKKNPNAVYSGPIH